MKILFLFVGLLFFTVSMNAQQSIEGVWNTGKDNTEIEIKNAQGKIYTSDNEKATSGKLMIKDLKKNNNAYKGQLYIIKKDRWVDAVFVPDGNSLTVTIAAGWQTKTLQWRKVK